MDNCIGAQIPKKSRSLDLKSLYEADDSKQPQNNSLKRKDSGFLGSDDKRNKRSKKRKAVPVSSFRDDHGRKSVNEVPDGGICSDSLVSQGLKESGLKQKLEKSIDSNGISLNLNHTVPRRKRGHVGRNKFEGSHLTPVGQSSTVLDNQRAELTPKGSGTQLPSSKLRGNSKGKADSKENKNIELRLSKPLKEEVDCIGHSVTSNDGPLKRSRSNRRTKKKVEEGRESVADQPEYFDSSNVNKYDRLQDDDEENLEENAARMLSSRFDPSFTGFSCKERPSASPSKALSGSPSGSADLTGRVLRPRTRHKEKGKSRKRRHFYEIFTGNLDPYWLMNRRIKVFWPLDQSWYYGLVNDYDKEKKLHHVKYDDRDEEWINLQNERFKLLLFSSEVPCKSEMKRSRRNRQSDVEKNSLKLCKEEKRTSMTEDDSFQGSYMDSEPIISWLSRSSHRVKSSQLSARKRQKKSAVSPTAIGLQSCNEAVDGHLCRNGGSVEGEKTKSSFDPQTSETCALSRSGQSVFESPRCPKESKVSIVYFRRRFRGTGKAPPLTSLGHHFDTSMHGSLTSVTPSLYELNDFEERGIYLEKPDPERDLWCANDVGEIEFNVTLLCSKEFSVHLIYPVFSAPKISIGVKKLGLFHSLLPLQGGVLIVTWPTVRLEILFVDNTVGLRFIVFEGCLKQAIAFVFEVLAVFYESTKHGKFAELQLPVTSIRFKFSFCQQLVKQFVFAFYSLLEVKNSKWAYLDTRLKSYCLLSRQLPLSECTYDNVKALQNMNNQQCSPGLQDFPSVIKPSIQGLRENMSRQGVCLKVLPKASSLPEAGQFASKSDKCRNLPPFALCFSAAPTFFLSLHLKLLMEHNVGHVGLKDSVSIQQPSSTGTSIADDNSEMDIPLKKVSARHRKKKLKSSSKNATLDGFSSFAEPELGTADLSICNGHRKQPSSKWRNGHLESELCISSSNLSADSEKTKTAPNSVLNGIRLEIPAFDQHAQNGNRESHISPASNDWSWSMSGVIPSPNPTAPRSALHRNRSNSSAGSFLGHGWSDGKTDLSHNNFGSGSRKPRTQVSYSLSYGGLDYSPKNKGDPQKGPPHKRIRKVNEKRLSDVSRGSQRNTDLLSCDANVLIILGDKGWRESGAKIVLELFDHNEWKIAVKVCGTTKYSYKAHQFLPPGSTNRYTHAMMWKGGKDWILEFPDRSQWVIFKEMHEECFNRNINTVSVKSIPIPGVRLIEEHVDNGTDTVFVRSSKYLEQVENDIEMALNPTRILYDMDSDDEQWVASIQNSSENGNGNLLVISEEMFEKTMDMIEKVAYVQKRDNFTSEEIEEFIAGVWPVEKINCIYEHWRHKRQRIGMPLIRHLQPPLWERYQQQLRQWERTMSKVISPSGYPEKVTSVEKPPMFAFCLKPRGLEVPNKGSKHRSQRKISLSGHLNMGVGDHDGSQFFGRRLNGVGFGDEKFAYPMQNYDSFDDSPLSQPSPMVFSPRDTNSMGHFSVGRESNHQRVMGKRKVKNRLNMDWEPRRPHYLSEGSDLDEYTVRDVSGAAQHALKMAKLKREMAHRLMFRADMAIHKAVVAMMTADAVKAFHGEDVSANHRGDESNEEKSNE